MLGSRRSPWLACALLFVVGASSAGDSLLPRNTTTQNLGALVDGSRDNVPVNDEGYRAIPSQGLFGMLFPMIPLANFGRSTHPEVIGFAHRRPPLLLDDVVWTAGSNRLDLVFEDELLIDVAVWIVDPTEGLAEAVADHSLDVSVIWSVERQGVAFDNFNIIPVSDDPDAAQFLDFSCGLAGTIKDQIGFTQGMINIYYVSTVSFPGAAPGTGNGVWCGGGVIGMGRNTPGSLLAHELGHAFHIHHVNDNTADFDTTNVMHNFSGNRRYLTEGQTFHAVYHGLSSLNNIYDVREGQTTRSCAHHYDLSDPNCPATQKRLWADGVNWPAN